MKTIITLTLLFLTSFTNPELEQLPKSTDENFSWLLGSWQRTNEKEGRLTFEHWEKQSKDVFIGVGCTLKDGDTIWQESIMLRKIDTHWKFEVKGAGEAEPAIFKLTKLAGTSFVCENPENEFPKVISYAKSEMGLKAIISGGGPTIAFEFKKIK